MDGLLSLILENNRLCVIVVWMEVYEMELEWLIE